MDLLDRYLQAVRIYLPKRQQDDIIKELGENLRAQMEDRESELGRPLNEDEMAALLKKHGHPLFVASRYQQPRYLIGPTLFPLYWLMMKIILVIVAFSYGVAAIVMLAESNSIVQVLAAVFSFASAVLPTFAWVTIVYAVLDLCNSRFRLTEKWSKEWNEKFDPQKLPAVQRTPEGLEAKPISRAKTVFELFWTLAFLLWWLRIAPIRKLALFMTLGPVGLSNKIPFQPGPTANTVFIPVIVLMLVGIVHRIVTLRYPRRVTFDAVMRLIANAGSVPILYLLSRSNEMFALVPGISEPEKFLEPMRIFNLILHYVMMFAAALTLIECFKQVRRLIRVRRAAATAPAL
jgi:hypothetical protein